MTEAEVTKEITQFLTAKGWRCLRMQSGLFRSTSGYKGRVRVGEPGMPDWQCTDYDVDGWARMFWLEMKAPGAKTSKERAKKQKDWADKERALGATVVQFDDPEKFKQWYGETYG